jgi:hypothetical protein
LLERETTDGGNVRVGHEESFRALLPDAPEFITQRRSRGKGKRRKRPKEEKEAVVSQTTSDFN